ncbi:ALF repeat-containing protein [Streptomyces spinoverrucosus]|uniref:ALF repeat-containing protein n=1 Tax=Streptomyces spinoverrucosus TaxID=284043 RepID=UPI0018C399C4|nr:ALF repeat-containing protein [Streptomyces spinoverrucosus]
MKLTSRRKRRQGGRISALSLMLCTAVVGTAWGESASAAEVGLPENARPQVLDAWQLGGRAVRTEAEAALAGTNDDLKAFLDSGLQRARTEDERTAVVAVLNTAERPAPHIAQVMAGHQDINVTFGYKAVYPDEAVQAHLALLARRRAMRPTDEYRVPTDEEWTEALGHFERSKASIGTCGSSFSTPPSTNTPASAARCSDPTRPTRPSGAAPRQPSRPHRGGRARRLARRG